MRAIKLNYDVVLTIFAEPSLWRAKIFEKNQDDPKNKNHKSTCTALKPISVIRKKKNTFYYLSFSFESNIFFYFFFFWNQYLAHRIQQAIPKQYIQIFMNYFDQLEPVFQVWVVYFFRQKQSIWLVIKLAKIQDSHD